jgi:hypothetical protein
MSLAEHLEERRLFAATLSGIVASDEYCVGDLNGDHKADLAVPVRHGIQIRLGKGDGTFALAQTVMLPNTPSQVAVGDLNGDGRLDLVTAPTADGIIGVLIGVAAPTGATTLASETQIFDDPFFFDFRADPKAQQGSFDAIVSDFDGDGKADICVTDQKRGVLVALLLPVVGSGQLSFERHAVEPSPLGRGVFVAAGDVNGDGRADLVGVDQQGQVRAAINLRLGVWDDTDIVHLFPTGLRVDRILLGDVNGDGRADIFAYANGKLRIAISGIDRSGNLAFRTVEPDGPKISQSLISRVAVGDVNGDGKDDLFVVRDGRALLLPYSEPDNL